MKPAIAIPLAGVWLGFLILLTIGADMAAQRWGWGVLIVYALIFRWTANPVIRGFVLRWRTWRMIKRLVEQDATAEDPEKIQDATVAKILREAADKIERGESL